MTIENKIAMLKWGKSVHSNQPSWSFSYSNEPLDAGLTMAATVASQNVPFESKTPTIEFLVNDDADTYDVDSVVADGGHAIDWYLSGQIEDHHEVTRLLATFSGHYSIPNVSQEAYIYNFTNETWVLMDTRIVGNESDSIVSLDIMDNPQEFIAVDGETRLRVRGVHTSQSATSWANSHSWLAYRGQQAPDTGLPIANNVSISSQ